MGRREKAVNMETVVNAKGQIVVPASLRRKYGIKHGTKIIVTDIGDAIVLKPVTEQYLRTLQGSLKNKGGLRTLLEERRKDKDREG
jgi:AbrB family looped-hinge helix DNA binding protein